MTSRPSTTADWSYEQDFYAWALRSAELLRAGRFDALDVEHIAEELEGMGKSERRALVGRLAVLLAHLLKWRFQPGLRSNSRRYTVREQREALGDLLDESPSLKAELDEVLAKAYRRAVLMAAKETGMDADAFPPVCPFSFEQAAGDGFWPD